ncbi:hypothetical protein OG895_34950 [Streptomyces sp. NBC_00201]|nr:MULTISPECIES: hypothetical protein [unclassified Streptomyces]MCX5250351.1 hypothetical protein [Streptomyces sp. NBC_00201]MCX5288974.1 hypothetical protein [Streptomyces sp. NBC_00183]
MSSTVPDAVVTAISTIRDVAARPVVSLSRTAYASGSARIF